MIVYVNRPCGCLNMKQIMNEILHYRVTRHPDMKRQRSRRDIDLTRFRERQMKERQRHVLRG